MNSDNAGYSKSSPRDVFTHLLAIITLYISAVSFGVLVFQFIDRAFPDVLTDSVSVTSSAIRWAIASLVIVFPVYVLLSWRLAKDVVSYPEKRELKIRKWLLYFTLFLASVVIIGDLVALIYNFLSGDLTFRFLLKIVTILFIALAVFSYYLWNLRSKVMAYKDSRMRVMVFGVLAIVATATVYGFFVAGSPFAERARRFDESRVQDLQNIQWQVVNYWQRKERLPKKIDELRDEISGYTVPRDPETGASYEYHVLAPLKLELCATFNTGSANDGRGVSQPVMYGAKIDENWMHGTGQVCFERTIDPELYPPIEKRVPTKM
ncbi:MAG: DUF5671 domain-containing protein [bacterium]|nr:DUF5671 domain-containing protein [bacterium]